MQSELLILGNVFCNRLIGNTCHSNYISVRLKKRTNTNELLQFPVEMNTRGSKTSTTFIPFQTKCDLQVQSFD